MVERTFEVPIAPGGGASAPEATDRANLFAIEVRDEGTPADAKVAILLHGGPGASHDYLRPQLDRLAGPSRRLVYYDQRGGGRSPLPGSWPAGGITEHLADLRAVIDAVSPAPPVLIGYSWGGLLALHFALEAPRTMRALLLLSPAPSQVEGRELMRRRFAAAGERPDVRAFVASLDRADRRQRFAGAIAGYFVDPRRALEVTPFIVRERAQRAVWDSLADYDLRPRLHELKMPRRIIHGVDDPVPVESARETAQLSGAELIELPRCGHVPFIEGGEAFFDAALGFLDRV